MSASKKIVKKQKKEIVKVDLLQYIDTDDKTNNTEFDDTEVINVVNTNIFEQIMQQGNPTKKIKKITKEKTDNCKTDSITEVVKIKKVIKKDNTNDSETVKNKNKEEIIEEAISKNIKLKRKYEKRSKSVLELNRELYKDNSKTNDEIKEAWNTLEEYKIPDDLTIITSHPGHFVTMGYDTGSLKNPYWLVKDKNDTEFYVMYCFKDSYTYFSKQDFKEIINPEVDIYPTWHYHSTGYVATKSYPERENTMIYLHQLVCKKYNVKERDNLSVDHINQNKLDNRFNNLRFADQSLQNQNRGKRKRQHNARPLPEGINHTDIPKYVVYYQGTYGPHKKMRNWFCIEQHPKLDKKRWEGTKSMTTDIKDKLKQAKEKLEELDKM